MKYQNIRTAAEQHIIDVVELAQDWNMTIPEEYLAKYREIIGETSDTIERETAAEQNRACKDHRRGRQGTRSNNPSGGTGP